MEMMLDKKQIWAIFLFEFKIGHKAAETTHNINDTYGPRIDNERTVVVQEEMRALKMRRDPLTWETAKEVNVNHSTVIQHVKQIKKVKKAQ